MDAPLLPFGSERAEGGALNPVVVLKQVLPLLDEYQRVLEGLGHAPPLCDYAIREDVRELIRHEEHKMEAMPPGYDAWKTRHPAEEPVEHDEDCPAHEDAPRAFECGGIEEHFCSLAHREINGCAPVEAVCTCPTKDDLFAADAEAREDARRDG